MLIAPRSAGLDHAPGAPGHGAPWTSCVKDPIGDAVAEIATVMRRIDVYARWTLAEGLSTTLTTTPA